MLKILTNLKKTFNRFINNMAKSNEENFGKGKMDCCDLNKKNERG